MNLKIENVELRPKNWHHPLNGPTLVIFQADALEQNPHIGTVFRSDCEHLLQDIFQRVGLDLDTKAKWAAAYCDSRHCLIASTRTHFDVVVTLAPDAA